MERKDLNDLEIYQISMQIGDEVWDLVIEWDNFAKNSMGYQIVRSADSIAANISEGYGRYFFKENRQFSYVARGSLYETKTFLLKAKRRKLVSEAVFEKMDAELTTLAKRLNAYIAYIESKLNK